MGERKMTDLETLRFLIGRRDKTAADLVEAEPREAGDLADLLACRHMAVEGFREARPRAWAAHTSLERASDAREGRSEGTGTGADVDSPQRAS